MATENNGVNTPNIYDTAIKDLNYIKLNLLKECYEWLGIDFGDTKNNIVYHNYLAETPLSLGNGMGGMLGALDLGELDISLSGDATKNKAAWEKALSQFASTIGLTSKTAVVVITGQIMAESGCFKYWAELGRGRGKKYGLPAGPYNQIYYGRGPIQVTWYDNYKKIYDSFFVPNGLSQYDIVRSPDIALDPYVGSLLSIGWLSTTHNGKLAISAANAGNVKSCRKAINGGFVGLDQCQAFTAKLAQAASVQVNLNA